MSQIVTSFNRRKSARSRKEAIFSSLVQTGLLVNSWTDGSHLEKASHWQDLAHLWIDALKFDTVVVKSAWHHLYQFCVAQTVPFWVPLPSKQMHLVLCEGTVTVSAVQRPYIFSQWLSLVLEVVLFGYPYHQYLCPINDLFVNIEISFLPLFQYCKFHSKMSVHLSDGSDTIWKGILSPLWLQQSNSKWFTMWHMSHLVLLSVMELLFDFPSDKCQLNQLYAYRKVSSAQMQCSGSPKNNAKSIY